MFEIITIQMHKLVKIPGIVNRQPWNRLNSYAAHSAFWVRRKQYMAFKSWVGATLFIQARHPCWMRVHVITLTSNLKTWCAGGGWGGWGVLTGLLVPVAFRNKCERAPGPKPEPFQSIFPGVNATRTSGTGLERDRNANRNRCEQGLIWYWFWDPFSKIILLQLFSN